MSWRPCLSLDALKTAARLRQSIRLWMQQQSILEVCTPALSHAANTDASVEPIFAVTAGNTRQYLHTSPEFAMKRILAAFPELDIYQIATVFRAEEQGRYHNSQFNLLEWYRLGMDHHALMIDVEQLFRHVYQTLQLNFPTITQHSYVEIVNSLLGAWPDELDTRQIQEYFVKHERSYPADLLSDLDGSLDLFVDEFVLPDFDSDSFTFLVDYPASKAALARTAVNNAGVSIAERFELYFGKVELANGFHELTDARQQRSRFNCDLEKRRLLNKEHLPMDENFLAALAHGLPECAGVALGLDRLQMVIGNHEHINEVVCFVDQHA